ncbi:MULTISPECIES: hypothetical protein [Microbacterium]|jgi:hypothetical protein|uniref:hypothetical protein n=1 Tax=Microbacterium TaxID=33882 RepID=UPI001D178CE5|nr:hypothetical protein [Microbacterium testaceum]MCC4247395.1 hypothetical protein [Microbacterium testaceum]
MSHPRRSRGRHGGALLVAAVSSVIMGTGSLMIADAALAALIDVPHTGAPGRLVLSSDPYPAEFLDLSPGEPAYWQIRARLEDATKAELALELRKSGALAASPRGLVMRVDVCDSPWSGVPEQPLCASGAREVAAASPEDDFASSSPVFELRPLTPSAPQYLLVTLAVDGSAAAASDETLMGLRSRLGVGLTATSIDEVPVRAPDRLAATGSAPGMLIGAGALAAGLLGVAAALRLGRRGGRS